MFKTIIEPRFGDVDGLGHINNTLLTIWFEQARTPIFRIFHPDLNLDLKKWHLIMVHIDVDFLKQIRFGADIEIRSYVFNIGNTSFTLLQEAWQNGELCASGKSVSVHYDFINKKSLRIPDDIRAKLSEHLVEEKD